MDKFYTVSTMMIVFSMIIMLISVRYNIGLTKRRRYASAILFGLIIIGVLCEWSGIMLDGKSSSLIPLHLFVKTVELSTAPFIGLMCGCSFSESKWEKNVFFILSINVILEIISVFTGLIFYVDSHNVYHHGPLYFIYLIAYVAGIIYFTGRGIGIAKRFHGKYRLNIMLVVMYVVICIVIQLMYDDIKIDWLAISTGAIMLYKFYGDMLLQMDGLTGLLNRWSYEHTIQNISKEIVVIFIDVDKFKEVNDNYGHSAGDTCLIKIAECIQNSYGKYGLCYRYGGDEFCVIMTRMTDCVENAAKELNDSLNAVRKEQKWMPGVSYGYARYSPEMGNIQDVINEADDLMYKYKEEHR